MDQNSRLLGIALSSFWPLLKAGLAFTIPLTLLSFLFGLMLGLLTALARLSPNPTFQSAARFYVWIFRGTPLLVQLFLIFYGLPKLGILLDAFPAALIGFSLNTGAYSSETLRAAISSVPRGQWDAAHALGMNGLLVYWRIVLPQAARIAAPPLANSFIALVKDTSLAATLTVPEMFQVAQRITAVTYEPLLLYSEAALIYLVFSSFLSSLQRRLEVRLSRHLGRRPG
jgi:L-cystine transport system permease protein